MVHVARGHDFKDEDLFYRYFAPLFLSSSLFRCFKKVLVAAFSVVSSSLLRCFYSSKTLNESMSELPKPQIACVLLPYWSFFPNRLCFSVKIIQIFVSTYHSREAQSITQLVLNYCSCRFGNTHSSAFKLTDCSTINTQLLLRYYCRFVTPYEKGLINPKTPYEWFLRVSSLDTEMRIYKWFLRVSYEWFLRVSSPVTDACLHL